MDSLFGKLIHHHHSHHDGEESPQQQQQQMRREETVTGQGSAPVSHVDDDSKKESGSSITSSSIYKTVVEGFNCYLPMFCNSSCVQCACVSLRSNDSHCSTLVYSSHHHLSFH